ncbi:MAG: OmpA family protein [Deltaproteobacteria bacterium]|nr:OmpA family protein [Deltaproteobacteria bacterium]
MKKIIAILFVAMSLAACAPKTIVVLTPDDDGRIGKVDVKTANNVISLGEAREYTEATDTLSKVQVMEEKTISKYFSEAMTAQPDRPVSNFLFFKVESVELIPDSMQQLPGIVQTIKGKKFAVVSIIGHTDTTGTDEINMALSQSRAEAVAKLLEAKGIPRSVMTLQYFGKTDLLVPTADGVPEPKNRRVEIFIR